MQKWVGEVELCLFSWEKHVLMTFIVWDRVMVCFKLLISFICQTVKVVCVGWVLSSPCWLMKKEKPRSWAENHRNLVVGGINSSVMIWDGAFLAEKKKHCSHKVKYFICISFCTCLAYLMQIGRKTRFLLNIQFAGSVIQSDVEWFGNCEC